MAIKESCLINRRLEYATRWVRTGKMLSSISSVKKQFQADTSVAIRIIKHGIKNRVLAWENKIYEEATNTVN